MYDNSDYGRGLADAYESGVKAANGTVVGKEQYAAGDTDFKAQLTKLKAAGPDLLFLSGYYPEGSKIAQQARELGMTSSCSAPTAMRRTSCPSSVAPPSRACWSPPSSTIRSDDPAVEKFVEAYKAKYKGANPDWFAATGTT